MEAEVGSEHQLYDQSGGQETPESLLLELLPNMLKHPYYQALNLVDMNILEAGHDFDESREGRSRQIVELLRKTLPTVHSACLAGSCANSHLVLYFKSVFWAYKLKILPDLVAVEEVIRLARVLMTSQAWEKVIVGLAISEVMRWSYEEEFKREGVIDLLDMTHLDVHDRKWIEACKIVADIIRDIGRDRPSFGPLIIKSTLDFILHEPDRRADDSHMNLRLKRLVTFASIMLDLPLNARMSKERIRISEKGREIFRGLIKNVVGVFNALQKKVIPAEDFIPGMCDETSAEGNKPSVPEEVELGLFRLASFECVLAPSLTHSVDAHGNRMRALRLLSILNEVNENWGSLFGTLTTHPIIERRYFESIVLKSQILRLVPSLTHGDLSSQPIPTLLSSAASYPFLISTSIRARLFRMKRAKLSKEYKIFESGVLDIMFARDRALDAMIHHMDYFMTKMTLWRFSYRDENAQGRGVAKECYTEISRDISRHDLDLWIGDPIQGHNGVLYTHSPCGMFPKPLPSGDMESKLIGIGGLIAKSILDYEQMDLNFSCAFYKILLSKNMEDQHLTLSDLKHVMPSLNEFVESLVDALREKLVIESDECLTPEECKQAVSEITCGGASFEDLYINFTLPCFPDIEMKPGGLDTFLHIHNVEEYLKLIIWWLLYKGPQSRFKLFRESFNHFLPVEYLSDLYPNEVEEVICGHRTQLWTVDLLKDSCVLDDGLTKETSLVQHLFEVVSSLDESEKNLFLRFVTSSARLPFGGLMNLHPRLTIKRIGCEGDPDTYLPSVMTCFNILFLPNYSCKEALREKLLLAIAEGSNSFQFI